MGDTCPVIGTPDADMLFMIYALDAYGFSA
jgi:hypothetical protein